MQAAVDEWQEENVKETESKAHYKNMAPKRPVCQKLEDHITLGVSRYVGQSVKCLAVAFLHMSSNQLLEPAMRLWVSHFNFCLCLNGYFPLSLSFWLVCAHDRRMGGPSSHQLLLQSVYRTCI